MWRQRIKVAHTTVHCPNVCIKEIPFSKNENREKVRARRENSINQTLILLIESIIFTIIIKRKCMSAWRVPYRRLNIRVRFQFIWNRFFLLSPLVDTNFFLLQDDQRMEHSHKTKYHHKTLIECIKNAILFLLLINININDTIKKTFGQVKGR